MIETIPDEIAQAIRRLRQEAELAAGVAATKTKLANDLEAAYSHGVLVSAGRPSTSAVDVPKELNQTNVIAYIEKRGARVKDLAAHFGAPEASIGKIIEESEGLLYVANAGWVKRRDGSLD